LMTLVPCAHCSQECTSLVCSQSLGVFTCHSLAIAATSNSLSCFKSFF
jgi:hypothetical protein